MNGVLFINKNISRFIFSILFFSFRVFHTEQRQSHAVFIKGFLFFIIICVFSIAFEVNRMNDKCPKNLRKHYCLASLVTHAEQQHFYVLF